MNQLHFFETPVWGVTQLTRYLRDIFESDPALQDLWVQGEISNFSRPTSGHLYFTLKDATGALKCVMWRNSAVRINFPMRDGQAVEVHGNLSIYEAAGQYQLYADLIRPIGEGLLFQEFLRRKAMFEAEGLFAPERKRAIPDFPEHIGIITSPTGAALQDILNILRRRYPLADVILSPTPVQGEEAPSGIIAALAALNHLEQPPDIILLARGGGSMEDLWAFNDEQVVRAVAASSIPIISGIGHETDFTLVDFVADLRAPTPTAAAELATPDRADLHATLDDAIIRLESKMLTKIDALRWEWRNSLNRMLIHSPQSRVRTERQRVDDLLYRAELAATRFIQIERSMLFGFLGRMASLNPMDVLRRGFAIVTQPSGLLIRSTTQVVNGDKLNIRLHDGEFPVTVSEKEET